MTKSTQLCTFSVAKVLLGLEVERVQEVIRFQEMTRVALASPEIEKLINLRGQIVTAIDMRCRFGFAPREAGELPMNVVLTPDHGSVSLLIDEIGDVLDLDERTVESPPATLDPGYRGLIRGVYKLENQLLLVLDSTSAIDLTHEVGGRDPSLTRSIS